MVPGKGSWVMLYQDYTPKDMVYQVRLKTMHAAVRGRAQGL